ncbi:hypothetical protein COW98_00520 [Candidatus Roizmanbacteria bacterium CG22_combo_CG10-13_8_21_14_all_35_9]|uniref:Uncharacterized protein n=3 Tax=Candidatus Roizmaniibacteriota TaxID=1752723 RepID=A0A2M8F294_9BACT|nr:MAG: hypothetical protein COX47_03070 [Candidatus Roizmanbacteria bacterium CG23_combo_of_CG06-09_8_20_14_all_35_49]PIP63095.1 MAG: hypothetical protein COW98_00520 [Candidatus Roizmanbacteria bacterium CG22_combo_CG10-13_8_21_14_all_35_9]PJC33380.1 MAG: hypothetical protein CO048_03245 [Candidatus Roizmanbacteria bacterium CG_4_9_14_0_2_um_filter_35_15]
MFSFRKKIFGKNNKKIIFLLLKFNHYLKFLECWANLNPTEAVKLRLAGGFRNGIILLILCTIVRLTERLIWKD